MAINSLTINAISDAMRVRVGTIEGTSRMHGFCLMPIDPTIAVQTKARIEAILFVKNLTNADKISFITDTINMLDTNLFNLDRVQFENVPDGVVGTYRFSALITERV